MHARTRDFAAARAAMQRYVDQEILAGVSWCVLRGRDVVDQQCVGLADREANIALRSDHIFRSFSNTKLFTTCALMLLVEEGRIGLDDRVEEFLPQLANRKVLKKVFPTLFRDYGVSPVDHYSQALLSTLRALAPNASARRHNAVLSEPMPPRGMMYSTLPPPIR